MWIHQLHIRHRGVSRQRRHHRQREANGLLVRAWPRPDHRSQRLRETIFCSHAGLAGIRCDDPAIFGYPLPPVALEQGQVRGTGEEQEGLTDIKTTRFVLSGCQV